MATPKGGRRQYSEQDKAAALAFYDAARGNLSQASRLSNVPRQTLQRWVSERTVAQIGEQKAPAEEEVELDEGAASLDEGAASRALRALSTGTALRAGGTSKGEVLRRWEELRDACFEDLKVARIEASFRDLVTAAKAATDMALLLRGTYDDEDIEELLAEFVSIVKKFVKDETTQAAIAEELRRAATSRRYGP